ncbi:acyltransferase [Paraferrimonas haliotis]|uniref:Acyltransferase n=1 Tax=Paraferrimonas haliotis TaxID=2013866 RepID=A0AA37WXU4_9GAMM|nr:acyltransferase [Paraferrimonas haliotis]GLS82131.1 acyltransferase [Paraferrimonas haliotis]
MSALLRLMIASVSFSLYVINTLFWVIPILVLGIVKLVPLAMLQKRCGAIADACASAWVKLNSVNQRVTHGYQLDIRGDVHLNNNQWYMVIANHQSWVDILVLQRALSGKVPFLKFFLKKELLYVPVLGLAWWALDFPFMRRYSAAQLRRKPQLKGKDIKTTQKACRKFKHLPVSVMNFVEGTRFTEHKHSQQGGEFTHLLRPKAGGLAFAISSIGEQMDKLLDVTIYYPQGRPSFWQFISGQVDQVIIDIQQRPIDAKLRGDYANDRQYKQFFQQWINQVWREKDAHLTQLAQSAQEAHKC